MVKSIITQYANIFHIVNQIHFLDIQQAFEGQETYQNKILCPFHSEKTPSFQVYDNCGHCFGCGWHGDGIDLVAVLENLPLIEAARLIARKFNLPIDREPTIKEKQKVNRLREKRELIKTYRDIEKRAFLNLADFHSRTLEAIEKQGLDIDQETTEAAHKLPVIDHYMMTLAEGSSEEKLQLLREGVLMEWAKKQI